MKNIEEQIVDHRTETALDVEATASSQLQDTHLRDADDSMPDHLRDADGSMPDHLRDADDSMPDHLRDADDSISKKFITPYFDKHDCEQLHWATFLPHWHQDDKYVFVTFRLADSLPQAKLRVLQEEKEMWLKKHPKPWNVDDENEYCDKFVSKIDKWLDSNYGECLLKYPQNRKIIEEALLFFDGERYDLKAFVVMPNHVHLLMQMKKGFNIEKVMRSLKSFTAKEINKVMHRTGRLWQSEYFDRIIRSEDHYKYVLNYIVANDRNLAKVRDDSIPYCVEMTLDVEATASSQLQDTHLRPADDSMPDHLRDADDSIIGRHSTNETSWQDELFHVVSDYSYALHLLDQYDHQQLSVENVTTGTRFQATYDNAKQAIAALREKFGGSPLFGNEKDGSFKSSIGQIYQTFDGNDLYPSVEEKAAMLLYLVTKNHSFSDGNKRIAATLFLWFLNNNGILYAPDGRKRIADNTLVALTLMIAESKPEEKDVMVKVVVNLINQKN